MGAPVPEGLGAFRLMPCCSSLPALRGKLLLAPGLSLEGP